MEYDEKEIGPLLTPEKAAELLETTVGTLAKYRSRREGPVFIKYRNRVYYPEAYCLRWRDENSVMVFPVR